MDNELPVQQEIDFSAIFGMVENWCELMNVDPYDFISFFEEVQDAKGEKNEEVEN